MIKLGCGVLLGSLLALSVVACSSDPGDPPTDNSKQAGSKSATDPASPAPASTADGGAAPAPTPTPAPTDC